MTKKAHLDLENFLQKECDEFGIEYSYEVVDDNFVVTLYYNNNETTVWIEYNNQNLYLVNDFELECKLSGLNSSSKYFWIVVAPYLF